MEASEEVCLLRRLLLLLTQFCRKIFSVYKFGKLDWIGIYLLRTYVQPSRKIFSVTSFGKYFAPLAKYSGNFCHFGKFFSALAIYKGLLSICQHFEPTFVHFNALLGKFSLIQMTKD